MKARSSFHSATANVVIGLSPAIIGPIAVAQGFADLVPKPVAIEIDRSAVKIDLAASLRAISASLKEARIVEIDANRKENVKVAAVERRGRG